MKKYGVTLRRTVLSLEEVTVDVEAESVEWAITEAFAVMPHGLDWKTLVEEQILLNLSDDKDLSHGKFISATAKKIEEGDRYE